MMVGLFLPGIGQSFARCLPGLLRRRDYMRRIWLRCVGATPMAPCALKAIAILSAKSTSLGSAFPNPITFKTVSADALARQR